MQKQKIWLVMGIAFISVIILAESVGIAYAQSADSDVLAVIRITNPGEHISNAVQYLDKIQPGMGGMVNQMSVGQMVFENPDWTGMDIAGEYTVVFFNPIKYAPSPFALIVPLTNKDEFLKVYSQTATLKNEKDGVLTFIHPAQQREIFVMFSGSTGIFSPNIDAAKQAKALVEQNTSVLTEAPGVIERILVMIFVDRVMATFEPMIDMFKQQMVAGLNLGMTMTETPQPQMQAAANAIQVEVDMLLALLKQTKALHLGAELQSEGIKLSSAVFAFDGSDMAKFFVAQSPVKSSLLGVIPADSGLAGFGSLNFTPEFIEGYVKFTEAMNRATPGMDDATIEKTLQWAREQLQVFGGEAAFGVGGLSQAENVLMMQVFALKDPAKAKQLIEQYPEIVQGMLMSGSYKNMGMTLDISSTGKTEYKEGEIFQYELSMKPDAMPDASQKNAFQAIFGESISVSIGFIGNYGVFGAGKSPLEQVQKIMDLLEAGEEVAVKYPPATYGFLEENNLFVHFSLPKLMQWGMKGWRQFLPGIPDFEAQEGPGMGIAARFVESRLEGELYVPVEEILAIRNIFQAMPSQSRQETPQSQPEEETQPESQPEEDVQPPAF